ncbi:O-linked N-acetylglucosamine transferase, SPINDLY family protein [Asticcacaulis taihuensis]|uniref:protein O-GlcNAc transferase n=1 Tax=Asticcacaulis taihuensis TaxID=260084 RepID=A0A1G4QJM7_9CAUL|nr:tetratricopeptide repeat protein [Asticcacaulis taihuensis]SCW44657.1 Predicted O-linked N-acetylglucosamine transferase, SPINDLY family [Asticcacaulis taihuensis]
MPDTAHIAPAAPGMSVMELIQSAEALKAGGHAAAAVALYETFVAQNPDHPLLYALLFNLGVILTDHRDLNRAREVMERALEVNPDFHSVYINLGRIYEGLGDNAKAVLTWNGLAGRLGQITGSALKHKTMALNQAARVLEGAHQDEPAETALRISLEIDPHQREAMQHFIALRQRQCAWPIVIPFENMTREHLLTGISPLSIDAYTDDPIFQLALSYHYNLKDVGVPVGDIITNHWSAKNNQKDKPIRIGYLSSDLREHAIGHLMYEVLGLHDRSKVEVFAYYCGIPSNDPIHNHYKETSDHFIDITSMDDVTAARRIADDGIQILIDVNGYTRDGRTKLLALRPAPVIVNWLGFPGSLGSPYHHYIIADDWIIPEGDEIYYSEAVTRLPCYQPNNRLRIVAQEVPTRAEVGLPEDAFVFCCFNGTHKITRFTFDRWLEILSRVPNSVLWLLSGAEASHGRLKAYAESKGIDPARIVFADKKANPHHLARYQLADLFLDTTPYGAHTTCSDALWMGVPVLTLSGRTFASRVCGSLVRAAGLPDELICTTAQDYIDRAVAIGRGKGDIKAWREHLLANRLTSTLFDTSKLVTHLEGLYADMWQACLDDRLPQPDLANLDTYFEMGLLHDHEAVEVQTIADYKGFWREKLAKRHAYRPVPFDNRLWKKPE